MTSAFRPAGRPRGSANLTHTVKGHLYNTAAFRKLVLSTIEKLPEGQPTVAGILDAWGDPDWDTPDKKKYLADRLYHLCNKGNLIRVAPGVYVRAEGPIKQPALHDIEDLLVEELTKAGGVLLSKQLRKAIGMTSAEARAMKLTQIMKRPGSLIRRDFKSRFTINLPLETMRNIVISPLAVACMAKAQYLGQRSTHNPVNREGWLPYIAVHAKAMGDILSTARQGAGHDDLLAVALHKSIFYALLPCVVRYETATASRAADRRHAQNPTDEQLVAYLRALEDPCAFDGVTFVEDHFRYLSVDLIRALADLYHIDPVALSWASVGYFPEIGFTGALSANKLDALELGEDSDIYWASQDEPEEDDPDD